MTRQTFSAAVSSVWAGEQVVFERITCLDFALQHLSLHRLARACNDNDLRKTRSTMRASAPPSCEIDDRGPPLCHHHGSLLAKEHLLAVQIRHSPRQHRRNLKLMRRPFRPRKLRDHVCEERRSHFSSGTLGGGTMALAALDITRTASDALSIPWLACSHPKTCVSVKERPARGLREHRSTF
jgi:hypothetical protein